MTKPYGTAPRLTCIAIGLGICQAGAGTGVKTDAAPHIVHGDSPFSLARHPLGLLDWHHSQAPCKSFGIFKMVRLQCSRPSPDLANPTRTDAIPDPAKLVAARLPPSLCLQLVHD